MPRDPYAERALNAGEAPWLKPDGLLELAGQVGDLQGVESGNDVASRRAVSTVIRPDAARNAIEHATRAAEALRSANGESVWQTFTSLVLLATKITNR